MKGVICAGGSGSRLSPLTEVTNKHLLAVYDKPMIFYPLLTLLESGVKDIMIVSSHEHTGAFLKLLGSGERFGANFSFKVQESSGGIAQALGMCKGHIGADDVAVILGDNIYEDSFADAVTNFSGGATLFLKRVTDANRFGVAELGVDNKIVGIEEKPLTPKSDFAVTGFYLYDSSVFDVIENQNFSKRNELEITDVNNHYVTIGKCNAHVLDGDWTDAGTFESLYKANTLAREISLNNFNRQYTYEKGSLRRVSGVRSDITV